MKLTLEEIVCQIPVLYKADIICIRNNPANQAQKVKWFINANDMKTARIVEDMLNKICLGIKFFSKYSVQISGKEGNPCSITLYTDNFVFSEDNVLNMSKALFFIAAKNDSIYDFWEIEIDLSN